MEHFIAAALNGLLTLFRALEDDAVTDNLAVLFATAKSEGRDVSAAEVSAVIAHAELSKDTLAGAIRKAREKVTA